ncbi:nucleoside hydrolase [Rhizobium rhizoryzae]|uniref:Inosine/uridine-preferring nucleoside hydrolase domain-containing protein n=1 Tax=Rhizobium rhizoryzae TaxID=451876 RepID=A0A7W6LKP8_9HYPH|nr:nucleoside hydrolase [Rhizobium rhizoryzae]MBB4146016.1 hypothetical protein [Rhizobium rhizoryzae]
MTSFSIGGFGPASLVGKLTLNKGGVVRGQRIIFDTDMDSDCDDVAALAMLLQLQRLGECTIIAATVASNNIYAAPCTKTLLRAAGLGSIPVGAYQGSAIGGGSTSLYAQGVVSAFGVPNNETRSAYDTAVNVLRRALARSPDGSVKIVIAGTCTNVAALLASSADAISPMTGAELVAAKVASIHVMGGNFVSATSAENNILFDIAAANAVASCGIPVSWAGYEVGNPISTLVPNVADGNNAFRLAWRLYGPANDVRPSWDLMAALESVRGTAGVFGYSGWGDVSFEAGTSYTTFSANASGKNRYITKTATDQVIANLCNGLIRDFMISLTPQTGVIGRANGFWRFDEGTGVFSEDLSGRARRMYFNFASAPNQPAWIDLGGGKYAVDFTPSQLLSPRYCDTLDQTSMVLSALLRLDTTTGIQQIITRRTAGGTQHYQWVVNSGVLRFIGFGASTTILSFGSIPAGAWVRVICVLDGTSVSMYVNGVQSGTTQTLSNAIPINDTTNGPFIGARQTTGYVDGLDGKIACIGYHPPSEILADIDQALIEVASSKGIDS